MKKKLLLTAMSATLSLGILGACGAGNNNLNDDNNGVNYSPVRYDRQNDNNVFDRNRDNNRNNNGVAPVRNNTDNNRGMFNGDNNNNGLFDQNHNLNTDLIDNNRGANGIDPGTNGSSTGNNGGMRSGTGGR